MKRLPLIFLFGLLVILAGTILVEVVRRANDTHGYVTYDQAVKLLRSGDVKTVGQQHNRLVILDLKNGTTVRTYEPRIDMISMEYSNCGEPCTNTTFWTE